MADDPTGATATAVKAVHITELRTAVNAVRSLAGQSSYSWTYSVSSGSSIHVEDVRDLRRTTIRGEGVTAPQVQEAA